MAIFPQSGAPQTDQETQRILNELIRRVNDIDRRVRMAEQNTLTQKQMMDNTADNLIKIKKDIFDRLKDLDKSRGENSERIHALDAKLEELGKRIAQLPSKEEFAQLKSTLDLIKLRTIGEEETDLDKALKVFEK